MQKRIAVLLVALIWGCGAESDGPPPETEVREQAIQGCPLPPNLSIGDNPSLTITTAQGTTHGFHVYVPVNYDHCHKDHPVVFMFHGAGQNAATWQNGPHFMDLMRDEADNRDFVLVWLDAATSDAKWNAGHCCTVDSINHVEVVDDLLSHLNGELSLAQKYAFGFSNGGAFVQHLAAERASTFSGFASIAGFAGRYLHANGNPSNYCWTHPYNPFCGWDFDTALGPPPFPAGPLPVNMMMVRGSQDMIVPVNGITFLGAALQLWIMSGVFVFTPAMVNTINANHSDYAIWKNMTGCVALTAANYPGIGETESCLGGSGDVRHDIVYNMGHFVPTNDPTDGNYANYDGPKQVMDWFENHP